MKVLFVTRGYPTDNDPVYGNFEADQAEALTRLDCDVTVLCVDRRFHAPESRRIGISYEVRNGVKVYRIYICPLPVNVLINFTNLIASVLGLILFKRVFKEQGIPDIIHAHYLFCLPLAVKIAKKYNIPIVETEHWSVMNFKKIPHSIKSMAKKYYPQVNLLVLVSETLRKSVLSHIGVDGIVINNIVNIYKHDAVSNHDGNTKFISVGRLVPIKGFDILIKAFKVFHDKYPSVSLTIVGDGPEMKHLNRLISDNHLHGIVSLTGKKNRKEVCELLHSSDFFVLPSHSETFGVVYIEAMSLGLPVIATKCGGPENFVTKDNGILVPTNDAAAVVDAMEYMHLNYNAFNRAKIAEYAVSHFSSEIISNEIIKNYKTIIKDINKNDFIQNSKTF